MPEGIQCDRCGEFERHGVGGGEPQPYEYEDDGWVGGPEYIVHIDEPLSRDDDSKGLPTRTGYTLCRDCREWFINEIEGVEEYKR